MTSTITDKIAKDVQLTRTEVEVLRMMSERLHKIGVRGTASVIKEIVRRWDDA